MKPFAADKACSRLGWCEGMKLALCEGDRLGTESKGLHVAFGWFGDERRPRRGGVTYNRKARDREGLMLNFCPWCGHSIRFDEEPTAAIAEGLVSP